ncbi:MAG: serine hydrolase domain-containing protein [Sandaracinaceae bacterium]
MRLTLRVARGVLDSPAMAFHDLPPHGTGGAPRSARQRRRRSAHAVVIAVVLAACGSTTPLRYPGDDWATAAPEVHGIRSTDLADVVGAIVDENLGLHSLTVVRHGVAVLDVRFFPYDGTRPHDVASVTKSLTSTAVGLAIAEGRLPGVEAPLLALVTDEVPTDDPRKAMITLADGLTMRAGLGCDPDGGERTLQAMIGAEDWVSFTVGLPMAHAPGSTWVYCSPVSHLLSEAVTRSGPGDTATLLQEQVLSRIGARSLLWPTGPNGTPRGWGDARLSPEDLARVGLLVLRGGRWRGRQVLDPAWVDEATTPWVDLGDGGGYGYQWWTAGRGVYASGRGGQFLFLDPEQDLLVVTTGAASPAQIAQVSTTLLDRLLGAVASDGPLPADPVGQDRLDEATARASTPPPPVDVPAPPAAEALARGPIELTENPLGWTSVTPAFAGDAALWSLEIAGEEVAAEVGLDGVPRITRSARFSADERHADVDLALHGEWTDSLTFVLHFDTLDRIEAGTVTFVVDGNRTRITLTERTYFPEPFAWEGELSTGR